MKQIEVSDEVYEKIKGFIEVEKSLSCYDDMIGKCFFIRTVTYHLVGRVKSIFGKFLELEDASWVADSGRFMNAIKEGTLNEVEPVGKAYVNTESITDFFPWNNKLPDAQK